MSEPKIQCVDCRTVILQRTADHHSGRCAPCNQKAAAIPPSEFEIPGELLKRLTVLKLNLEQQTFFREMVWREGTQFANRILDKIEEGNKLYREWAPRLRAFAAECRAFQPPGPCSLTNCDRAKQQIYEAKLARPAVACERVAICQMPLIAIQVAQRLWPQDDSQIVLLTPEEVAKWNEIYSHPEESFWWFAHFMWSIDDSPTPECFLATEQTANAWDNDDLQPGETPWIISVGEMHGPLAGAGHDELWAWNGSEARFIQEVSIWVS